MNTTQSTLSSPRNQRILFWIGLLACSPPASWSSIIKLAGGSDSTPTAPDKGFKPRSRRRPRRSRASNGGKVTSYEQLPSQVKQAIVGFVTGGVLHNDYGASWKYTAPNITHGASQHKWATVDARSVIPLPGYTLNGVTYRLEGRRRRRSSSRSAAAFQAVHRPAGADADRALSVRHGRAQALARDYWMPATNDPPFRTTPRRRIGRP